MINTMNIEQLLEAVLFYQGEPIAVPMLARYTEVSEAEVRTALDALRTRLAERGLRLVEEGGAVALATAPEAAPVIEKLRKGELEGPLGKAGLETLAIIVYQHPVSRADIEYIRGVNCQSILRSLTMRGLVERDERNGRGYVYRPTIDLPAALGVARLEDLPEYASLSADIEAVTAVKEKAQEEVHDA